jgi:hypothetical protein
MTSSSIEKDIMRAALYQDRDLVELEVGLVDIGSLEDIRALGQASRKAFGDDAIAEVVRGELALSWLRALVNTPLIADLERDSFDSVALAGLDDSSWFVRACCAEAFSYLGSEAHVPRLLSIAACRDEHATVRADALGSAILNAPKAGSLVRDFVDQLPADESLFVRCTAELYALILEVGEKGPSFTDIDAVIDCEDARGSKPPQEIVSRILRIIQDDTPEDVTGVTKRRLRRIIDHLELRGIHPLWKTLVEPARRAISA